MEDIIVVFADIDTPQEENEEFIELIKACDMNIVTCFDFTNEGIRGLCHDRATYFPAQSPLGAALSGRPF